MINNFVLIIGAMKCGTTSLFRYLAEHPQVAPCKIKEPNFFTSKRRWAKGFESYQSLWDYNPSIHRCALEASVNYTKIPRLPNAAERIHQIACEKNINFKFIYLIRNPIERIESHCTHDLEEQWSKKHRHEIRHGIPYPAIEISQYASQIDEYYKRFSKESIMLLDFETLKNDPCALLTKTCQFLEIDTSFNFPNVSNVYNATNGKTIASPMWPSIEKYFVYPLIRFFPLEQRGQMMTSIRSHFNPNKIESNIRLSEQQRDFVLLELRDDLQKLSLEYGIDVSRWDIQV
jgi:hypothetical protein